MTASEAHIPTRRTSGFVLYFRSYP